MCYIQCTLEEIAAIHKCSVDTIENRVKEKYGVTFSEFYKSHSSGGKMSLRRAQFKKAVVEGNPALLVWLGKQQLNQSDKVAMHVEVNEAEELPTEMLTEIAKKYKEPHKRSKK